MTPRTPPHHESPEGERDGGETLGFSQATLAKLVEFSPDAIVTTDGQGRIEWVNAQTEKLFGYNRNELVRQPVELLVPERFRQMHLEHRRAYHGAPRTRLMGAGVGLYGRRKNGTEFPADIMLSPIDTGRGQPLILTIVRDITERKWAEEALQLLVEVTAAASAAASIPALTSACLETICKFRQWPLGQVWFPDGPGNVLLCSADSFWADFDVTEFRAASLETALEKGRDLPGRVWKSGMAAWVTDVQDDPNSPRFRVTEFRAASLETALEKGRDLPGRVWKSGMAAWVTDVRDNPNSPRVRAARAIGLKAGFAFPVVLGGEVLAVFEFLSRELREPDQPFLDAVGKLGRLLGDVLKRKSAEEALEEARADLARVARVTMMGELTAAIAHEINQPLAAIVNNANACSRVLGRTAPDLDEVREAVTDIAEAGTRASEVIARIRGLLKKAVPEKSPLDVNEAIREVLALSRTDILRHGVKLRTDLAAQVPLVRGDRVQLQQVILNLVLNGIEALSPVTDRPRDLLVASRTDEAGHVIVAVQDTGVGVDPRHMDRIFTALFTTKPDGMGMGLWLSRSIIEAHGGRLWATPNEGPGVTFQFALPAWGEGVP